MTKIDSASVVQKEAKELVSALTNLASRRDRESSAAFIEEMRREHRTNQQSISLLMLQWFANMANWPDGQCDARNQDSVRVAREMMEAMEGRGSYRGPDGKWFVHLSYI